MAIETMAIETMAIETFNALVITTKSGNDFIQATESPMEDCYTHVMGFLSLGDAISLGMAHKESQKACARCLRAQVVTRFPHTLPSLEATDRTPAIRCGQAIALLYLQEEMSKGGFGITVIAPPSFGKTLVGLEHAYQRSTCGESVVIICPPKLIMTWEKEIKSFFGKLYLPKDPKSSHFLVWMSERKEQAAFLCSSSLDTELKGKVLIISASNKRLRDAIHFSTVRILDEPQVGTVCGRMYGNPKEIVCLTALRSFRPPWTNLTITFDKEMTSIPEIDYDYAFTQDDQFLPKLGEVIRKGDKTVLFMPSDVFIKEHFDKIQELCNNQDIKLFRLVKALTVPERFIAHKDDAVMIVNTIKATEGVNLGGNRLVIINPLSLNPDRAFQCISRLLRTSNPFPKVKCTFLTLNSSLCRPMPTVELTTRIAFYKARESSTVCVDINYSLLAFRLLFLEKHGVYSSALRPRDLVMLGSATHSQSKRYNKWKGSETLSLELAALCVDAQPVVGGTV